MFLRTIRTESHPIPSHVLASSGESKLLELAHEDALRKIDELTKDRDFLKEKIMRLEERAKIAEKQASEGVALTAKSERAPRLSENPFDNPDLLNSADGFTISIPIDEFGDLEQPIDDIDWEKFDRDFKKGGDTEEMKKLIMRCGFSREYVDNMKVLK